MNPTMLPIVFSVLNGAGYGFMTAWILVILVLTVVAVPYLIVVFPLYRASGYITDEWSPLGLVPFANAAVLTRRVRGSWDATSGALLLLTPPFCLAVHLAVFSWLQGGNDYDGSVPSAWLQGNLDLFLLLFLAEVRHSSSAEQSDLLAAFLAAIPTVFAHWLVFGWWPWLEITRDLRAPTGIRWLGAIPVIGLVEQWVVASRAKEPCPYGPDEHGCS